MNPQTITPSPPVQEQIIRESKVVLKGVSWQTFQALLADVGDDRAWRIAYDNGVLEIRMPYQEHEMPTGMLESFIEALADELEIEVMKLRSLLLKREDLSRAIEPDTCFYIQNEALVRSRDIDLETDPPPDLAVESDYTNSSLNKFAIYAALGVPEIWRYRRQTLEVYQLVDDKYESVGQSVAFPFLLIAEIPGFIEQSRAIGQRSAVRLFRTRIREILQNSNL
ncbi:MAG: Uma2 family endonuclease [Oscillatoriales cyanobacterium]|nr:MAG: Uma2 family endonuclease [Oscillatoriales cyanobacterium]